MYLTTVIAVTHCILHSELYLFSLPASDAGQTPNLSPTRKYLGTATEVVVAGDFACIYELLKNGLSFVFLWTFPSVMPDTHLKPYSISLDFNIPYFHYIKFSPPFF